MPQEHLGLRGHMGKINQLGDFGIKWRRQHEAGLALVDAGEFGWAIRKEAARLATANTVQLAWDLNGSLLAKPDYNERVTSPVTNVDFVGHGRFRGIAYILESGQLEDERRKATTHIDALNGVNSNWRPFEPHVVLATVAEGNMDEAILNAFWDFAPPEVTLMPARAVAK